MMEFQRENERAEMTMEVMGDTMDDVMAEEGDEEEEESIVQQVSSTPVLSIAAQFFFEFGFVGFSLVHTQSQPGSLNSLYHQLRSIRG